MARKSFVAVGVFPVANLLLFRAWKKAVDGLLWFVNYFDLMLIQYAPNFLGYTLYIRQHYKIIEVVFGGLCG